VRGAWLACHWFAGRAAFLLTGAMIATAMSANVFFWIIPGQRKVVASIKAGQPVDPIHGQRGKQRSVHNTYFTLPVLFAMLSNHYSFLSRPAQLAGADPDDVRRRRHPPVLRDAPRLEAGAQPHPRLCAGGRRRDRRHAVWLAPDRSRPPRAAPKAAGYAQVQKVLEQRCYLCHGAQVQMKNVRLDSPEALKQHAAGVYQQAVVAKTMPMNNATGITDAERATDRAVVPGGGEGRLS
jgi:uncharacterized membrane protein